MIEACFFDVEPLLGTRAACLAVGRSRATHYRRQAPAKPPAPKPVRADARANVNTPGFHASGVSFESALSSALQSGHVPDDSGITAYTKVGMPDAQGNTSPSRTRWSRDSLHIGCPRRHPEVDREGDASPGILLSLYRENSCRPTVRNPD